MPTKPQEPPETPRTDLPPEREPYYEGYYGTEEEEGVVREEERKEGEDRKERDADGDDWVGGDREI